MKVPLVKVEITGGNQVPLTPLFDTFSNGIGEVFWHNVWLKNTGVTTDAHSSS